MTNVYRLPDREDATAEACEWLARLERGLTEEEDRELRKWIGSGQEHAAALIETAGLWDRMDSLSRLADLFPRPAVTHTQRPRVMLALAASLLLVAIAGLLLWVNYDGAREQTSRVAAAGYHQSFETAIGEHSTVRLPDGSELTLNTNSRVAAHIATDGRTLRLERGEVYVKVAHDRARPFSVWAGEGLVQAVGTEFNVQITEDQKVEVIVTEGRVLIGVADGGQSDSDTAWLEKAATPVSAGERVLLSHDQPTVQEIGSEDIDVKLSWRNGNLVFHGEPLEDALGEIERYTRVEFIIRDEELKTIRVAGLFKAGDVDGLLATLRENFNISYERVGEEKIVLRGERP